MRIVTTLFILFNSYLLYSQNLVLNSSFEDYTTCPAGYGGMLNVKNWNLSDKLNSVYVNDCDTTNGPFRDYGYVKPHTGKACAAFGSISSVVGQFSSCLIKDSLYKISAFVHLAPKSDTYFEYFEVYFESYLDGNIIKLKKFYNHIDTKAWYMPSIKIYSDSCRKKAWVKISSIYKAKGGEGIVCFGAFGYYINGDYQGAQKLLSGLINPNNTKDFKSTLYYIDDVSVVPYQAPIAINQTVPVYDILFNINSSEIQAGSNAYLDKLADYLKIETGIKIEISGHTDNTGTFAMNNTLSLARAESVKKYFTFKGIASGRITTFGFGSAKPIMSNKTTEGRAKNRRIEFKLIK